MFLRYSHLLHYRSICIILYKLYMYGGLWVSGFCLCSSPTSMDKRRLLGISGLFNSWLIWLAVDDHEYGGGLVNYQAGMTQWRQKIPPSANLMKLVFLLMAPLKAAGSKVFISSRYLDKSEGLMWTALLKPPYLSRASWSLRACCCRGQDPSPKATNPSDLGKGAASSKPP